MREIRTAAAPMAEGSGSHRPALRRAARMLAVAPFVATTVSGCYSYRRVDSREAPVGAEVATEITDQGRVALADSLGRSPERVEGRLVAATDSSITLAVTAVSTLRGERAKWTGEQITLRRTSFSGLSTRQLSKGRTAIGGALVIAAAVLLAVTLGITGDGDGDQSPRVPVPPTGEQ